MTHQIATIARYTLLEAVRTRLPHVTAAVVVLLAVASAFIGALAITEAGRMQLGVYAATVRVAAVFIAAMHVLGSMTREFNDKGLDMALALDLPRSHYMLGKLAGFLLAGIAIAALAATPLAVIAPAELALKWGLSLGLEIGIVMALALFCTVTFRQPLAAASFVVAFYLLARTLTAIRLMSAHPVVGVDSPVHHASQLLAEGLALVIPALDGWTRTAWLVSEPPAWSALAALLGQSLLYIALLAAAAMFDFYRRNF